MSFDPRTTGNFTDFAALTRLKAAARMDKRASTSTVARQFETLFTQMMLKSMRSASLGSGILDSEQSKQYRDLADSQLAMSLSTRGNGLGIAKMLERQLLGHEPKDATPQDLIREAYLRIVSRPPTDEEVKRCLQQFTKTATPAEALEDVLWALLNTQEFVTNH